MNTFNRILLGLGLTLSLNALAAPPSELATYNGQKLNIVIKADHPQFTLKLESNPSTGYSWFLKKFDARYVAVVEHHFQAATNTKLIGAPGVELWTFKMKPNAFVQAHQTSLTFDYKRPWEKQAALKTLVFWVRTTDNK